MRLRLELFVAHLDASIRFYTQVLGYRLIRREDAYAELRRGAAQLGLAIRALPDGPRGAGVEIVLEVQNLEAVYDAALEAGAPVAEPPQPRPWGLRDFRVTDPDGYYVRVTTAS